MSTMINKREYIILKFECTLRTEYRDSEGQLLSVETETSMVEHPELVLDADLYDIDAPVSSVSAKDGAERDLNVIDFLARRS